METINANRDFGGKLSELYSCERQMMEALPIMTDAACSHLIQDLLTQLCEQCEAHRKLLGELLQKLGQEPGRRQEATTRALLKEAGKLIEREADLELIDIGLVELIQKLEMHIVKRYEAAAELAQLMGDREAVQQFQAILLEQETVLDRLGFLTERCAPCRAVAI